MKKGFVLVAALLTFVLSTGRALALEQINLNIKGANRVVLIERPSTAQPLPTIILLHGLGGNAMGAARASGLAEFADQQQFVAVFPDGVGHAWNHLPPGDQPQRYLEHLEPTGLPPPDDVAFLNTLAHELVSHGYSDPKRLYIAGISAGGFMTLRMLCTQSPQVFAAAALVISGMPTEVGADCHPAGPIPVLMIKGTNDPNVPYNGGLVMARTFEVWPTDRLISFFEQINACRAAPTDSVLPVQIPYQVEVVSWPTCTGAPIVLYRVIGGVHQVPPEPNLRLTLWNFFRDKSLH